MKWYIDMTEKEKNDFRKGIAVSGRGALRVLLVPIVFHLVLR